MVWTKTNSSIIANTSVAPDGTTTADKLVEDATSNSHQISINSISVTQGLTYTTSIYVKSIERSQVVLFLSNVFGDTYITNLATDPKSTNVGNGWYRISITAVATSTGTGSLYVGLMNGGVKTYTGDGTSGIYVWGAQLENSVQAGAYTPTTTTAITGIVNRLCKGLLIEEARTNVIRNSTMQGAVTGTPGTLPTNWSNSGVATNGVTVNVAGTGIENGMNYVDVRWSGTATANLSTGIYFDGNSQNTASNGQTWTASNYIKIINGAVVNNSFSLGVFGRVSGGGGNENSGTAFTPSTSFTRISTTYTMTNASTVFVSSALSLNYINGTVYDITLRIYAPQLELGSFPTSYIPTTTVAITRNVDVVQVPVGSWYNNGVGTFFLQAIKGPITNVITRFLNLSNTIGPGLQQLYITQASMTNNVSVSYLDYNNTTSLIAQTNTNNVLPGNIIKFGIRLKDNDHATIFNGVILNTSTTGLLSPMNVLYLGDISSGIRTLNSCIQKLTYYPTGLPNSRLQSLTQ